MYRFSNFKRKLSIFMVYLLTYLACTALFIGLFHTEFLSGLNVLMYRGIVFIILTGIVAAFIVSFISKKSKMLMMDGKDVLLMFCGFCCVNMVLFTLIPVTVERSVSVFTLSYMEECMEKNPNETFTEAEIKKAFIDYYVDDFGAFKKRFDEQVVTGAIEKANGGYRLTESGHNVVKLFRTIAEWFDTDKRLVYPLDWEDIQ